MKLVTLTKKEKIASPTGLRRFSYMDISYFVLDDDEYLKLIYDIVSRQDNRPASYDTGDVNMALRFELNGFADYDSIYATIHLITEREYKLLKLRCDKCESESCEKTPLVEGIRCDICNQITEHGLGVLDD